MSRLTDYGENKLADMVRGQGLVLPDSWHFALASAASDSAFTELAGTDYARFEVARALASFSGTQAPGSTLASTGISHQTRNNIAIDFGTVGAGGWGTANYLVMCDNDTLGNAWAYSQLDSPIICDAGEPAILAADGLAFTLGLTGGCSDYLANKLIDLIWRGQAFTWPATAYAAYCTAAPTNAAAGTEPAVGGYARVAIASTMAAWSGTQGEGTTTGSTGTDGVIGNNAAITFPAPTADQGTIGWAQLMDAAVAGNMLVWHALTAAKTIVAGGVAPHFAAHKFRIAFR